MNNKEYKEITQDLLNEVHDQTIDKIIDVINKHELCSLCSEYHKVFNNKGEFYKQSCLLSVLEEIKKLKRKDLGNEKANE